MIRSLYNTELKISSHFNTLSLGFNANKNLVQIPFYGSQKFTLKQFKNKVGLVSIHLGNSDECLSVKGLYSVLCD